MAYSCFFSEWAPPQPGLTKIAEQVNSAEMPPTKFTILHPSAKLTSPEKAALLAGMRTMYAQDPPPAGRGGDSN